MALVTFGAEYVVVPGKEEAFLAAVRRIQAALAKAPGHTQTRLFQDTQRPEAYLIYSEWSDRAAFEAFLHSDAFAQAKTWGREGILAERPRHQIFTRD